MEPGTDAVFVLDGYRHNVSIGTQKDWGYPIDEGHDIVVITREGIVLVVPQTSVRST